MADDAGAPDASLEQPAERLPGCGYSEEEIARGLQAVALFSGNTRQAARHLKKIGHPVPRTTLRTWQTQTYAEEYERARFIIRDRVWEELAEEHQAVARQALGATKRATAKAKERLEADDVKGANSAASAARNLATVAGISNDKSAVIHGRPIEQPRTHSIEEDLAALRRMGVIELEPEDVIEL